MAPFANTFGVRDYYSVDDPRALLWAVKFTNAFGVEERSSTQQQGTVSAIKKTRLAIRVCY
jgi:hypothetical protein